MASRGLLDVAQTYCNPIMLPDYPRGMACNGPEREPMKEPDCGGVTDTSVISGRLPILPCCITKESGTGFHPALLQITLFGRNGG